MSYLTIVLEGGPLDGGHVPMTGGTVRYGHILELPYTEETHIHVRSDYSSGTYNKSPVVVDRKERRAVYKCMAAVIDEDGVDTNATFVGVLR